MGDVVQAMPSSASLAMRNSAEAQQLFGTAWGVPLCSKKLNTYTPPRELAIVAASSAFVSSSPHIYPGVVLFTYTRLSSLLLIHLFVVGALLPARQQIFGRTGS
jgi:hypothetical protein